MGRYRGKKKDPFGKLVRYLQRQEVQRVGSKKIGWS